MRAPGEFAGFWTRMGELDEEIRQTAQEGYDVDCLLEDRAAWQRERDELMEGLS